MEDELIIDLPDEDELLLDLPEDDYLEIGGSDEWISEPEEPTLMTDPSEGDEGYSMDEMERYIEQESGDYGPTSAQPAQRFMTYKQVSDLVGLSPSSTRRHIKVKHAEIDTTHGIPVEVVSTMLRELMSEGSQECKQSIEALLLDGLRLQSVR